MIVNTNIASLNAQKSLLGTNNAMQKSLEKLSSGSRINKAADDAAGLAISEKMRGQIKGLNQAVRNAQSAISLIQTGEGALNETHSILQRMRELAVQSASDTNTADDRSKIQAEMDQLAKEITRISNTTEFNTQNLLAGGLNDTFHIGANKDQSIALSINAMDAMSLGVAGSTVTTGGEVLGTTGITNLSNAGRGLETGTGYSIVTDNTEAAISVAMAKGGTGTAVAGNATLTSAAAYTGTTSAAYMIQVQSVANAGADVSSIRYSTDAGDTWKIATGNNVFDIGNGLEFNTASLAGGAYDTGTTFSFTIAPETTTFELYDTDGTTQIGATATAYVGSTSITIGNTAADKTIQVNYTYSNLADGAGGGKATFNVVSSASTAATVVNGVVQGNGADTKAGIAVNTQIAANNAISTIDSAINTVSEERSKLGAMQNRLEHTINNLQTASENMTSAESRIRDVDMAAEMSAFTKSQILSQAGVAMLAQANQVPQAVLKLLG